MNVQCHIIISSTTSLCLSIYLKKGHSTRPSLVTEITSLLAVSILLLEKTCFVVVVLVLVLVLVVSCGREPGLG